TWLDWDLLERNRDMFRFFKHMIAFRKAHRSIGRSRFWREDVHWYGPAGDLDFGPESRRLAYCLHGASQRGGDIYVMINAHWRDRLLTVQEGQPCDWRRVVDTGLPSPHDIAAPGDEAPLDSLQYRVAARSIVVLYREYSAEDCGLKAGLSNGD